MVLKILIFVFKKFYLCKNEYLGGWFIKPFKVFDIFCRIFLNTEDENLKIFYARILKGDFQEGTLFYLN